MRDQATRAGARVILVVVLLLVGCAYRSLPDTTLAVVAPPPAIRFGVDTIAFQNDNRIKNRGKPDLYANWCFIMARAVTQFHRFARFDPSAPRLSGDGYVELVREVTARAPWRSPLSPDDRIVIPGYASLYDFSLAEEAAVKAGFGARWWTWIHWTNWRVAMPLPRAQQVDVARQTVEELQAGRPVQWLITNLPDLELNHTVLVYDYRVDGQAVDFIAYDPNDPRAPDVIRFDPEQRRFWATRIFEKSVGPIRAFRMYYSPLL